MKKAMNVQCLWIAISLLMLGNSAVAEPPPARVITAPVTEREMAATQKVTGMVDFDRISEVSTEIGGLISEQHSVEGQQIKRGEVILQLNSDLLRKDIDIKRKERDQISVDMRKIEANRKRLESLLKSSSVSRQAYDDASFDLRSLKKQRETLELELEKLKITLEKHTLRAPFDGIVLQKMKEAGEWINPGTAVIRLASTADTLVKVSVSESLIRFQTPGVNVPVTIPALELNTEGKILGLIPVADQRSRSLVLKINLGYAEGLTQNMSARVEIPAGEKQLLKVLPRDAVIQKQGNNYVFAIEEGIAKQLAVKIISRDQKLIAIQSAELIPGKEVVIDGNARLRPNQAVEVIERL